jgi:hypothetical protein
MLSIATLVKLAWLDAAPKARSRIRAEGASTFARPKGVHLHPDRSRRRRGVHLGQPMLPGFDT